VDSGSIIMVIDFPLSFVIVRFSVLILSSFLPSGVRVGDPMSSLMGASSHIPVRVASTEIRKEKKFFEK